MIVDDILTAAGINYRETRFVKPPSGTYAVYMDDVEADGPDGINMLFTHNITIELYEPAPDAAAETAIEVAIGDQGLRWTKQSRYWIQEEQLYQTIYEFTFYERRPING